MAALEQDARTAALERDGRKSAFDRLRALGGRLRKRRRLITTPEEMHA